VLLRIFAGEEKMIEESGWDVKHCGYCGKCGRVLTEPESLESGLGPICRKAMMAERF
jgi:hypothetical protein